jgi:hypothetical protein
MFAKILYYTSLIYLLFVFAITTSYARANSIADSLQIKNNKPNAVTTLTKDNKPDSLKSSVDRNDNLMHLKNMFNRIILPDDKSLYLPNISFPDMLYQKYNYLESNELDSFRQNLTRSLGFSYNELAKYNLGIIGNYLGTAKNLFAIILALLSL